ncbi:MAG: hypothetical protein HY899_00455 [Deltaproteobacteria bacterium]|nr:hypothetical protein [Deltaproteobacteria bacterium]
MPGPAPTAETTPTRRRYPPTPVLLVVAIAIVLRCSCALAAPGPGPGEPFGGDDAGCVPSRSELRRCSDTAARAYSRLETSLGTCHTKQAAARYAQVILGRPKNFDEENCEAFAAARFDATLANLDASGDCGASALLTTAPAAGAALHDALDARGADLYCDASSGAPIDPGGDDAGSVPASRNALTCTRRAGKALGKLASAVARCHQQAAAAGFTLRDPPFDEEACEDLAVGVFDDGSERLLAKATCPACLDAAALVALRDGALARLDADNAAVYPCPDPVLHPGTPLLDRPTLMAVGVQLPISGDEDRDASVALRYRAVGAPAWKDAPALLRVKPETTAAGEGSAVPEQFAGSIFDLRPATTYELELHAVDADGPVDELLALTATTRALPADPSTPHPVAVADATQLAAALAAAGPGDVITLADGLYSGAFVLEADGTAGDPIVIRGTSRDGTILDGNDCLCNVLEVYGSYVHVENLTLRNAQRALRFQTSGAVGNVVRRVHTVDTRLGLGTRDTQFDFYFCDNLLEGRLVWPHVYTDNDGADSGDDGILVQGHGQVVCHNQLIGFGDALKNGLIGARSLDFYGNEVLSAYDNAIELDIGEGNLRAWRNRFTNSFATISFQPIYGGPAYAVRNVVVNVADEQMKFHGLGEGAGPSGVLAWNNTFVSPGIALQVHTYAASHNFEVSNNLFVGPAVLATTRTVDWTAPIVDATFDANGYYPDGAFRFDLEPDGLTSYASFAAMQADGMETAGSLLAEPIFQSGLTAPAGYTQTLAPADVTLDAASNAVDAGTVIPGITGGYLGSAPDLGALERGCPLPIFGIRPPGIDESNEPIGCE